MKSKKILCVLMVANLMCIALPLWGQHNRSIGSTVFQGISDPKETASLALIDARNNAYRNLAASFSIFVDGIWTTESTVSLTNPNDATITVRGFSGVMIRMQLTGVQEIERVVERTAEGYIAHVLITISEEGRRKAENYVVQENAAFRAYNIFSRRHNLPMAGRSSVPAGYSDFSGWLESNALIFQIKDGRHDFLVPLETFLQKFNRRISIFSDNFGGKPARIIFNTPCYFNDIANILRNMNIMVSRENGRVLLSPNISLNEFLTRIQRMPDAGMLTIAGIAINGGNSANISSDSLNEIARIAVNNHGLRTQILRVPEQLLGNSNYREIMTMPGNSSRYTILLRAETISGAPIAYFGIPSHEFISYRIILLDSVTGRSFHSNAVIGGISFSGSGANTRLPLDLMEIINNLLKNL